MSDALEPEPVDPELETEAAGETVGEAKWTALRDLERRFPGLDKSQVEFVVVSEGQRGLLGVGFAPARVIARITGRLPGPVAREAPADTEPEAVSAEGESLRALLGHVRDALSLDASIQIRESGETVEGSFRGRDLGIVIGKRGQTIDAIQHLASAIVLHTTEGARRDVVVDAAGYRDRRRATLEALADRTASRVVATGRAEKLEPMSAAERKVVHLRLQGREDVVTESEGAEPERCVVILPSA